ncbi:SDR family NAD(P)-dependent oxidoreductase [Sphingobacterium faecium]|uniref:SDR family NAD(P)-dependent oxidoreductase n=1 Tax=Sphingobacterium faecium TaxID=34087 RepID=UPI001D17777F|nr:SDR family NAD(P)-dependent oxidoreductase [Sphingobacterium faecium]
MKNFEVLNFKHKMMQTSKKRVALVTGANTGVGFQIAKALIENNYTVFVGARNLENGINAASQLGNNAIAIELDVTKQNTISAAVEKIQTQFGKLNLLVNNAGISHAGKPGRTVEEVVASNRPSIASLDETRTVWETNVFGVVAVIQAFIPLLKNAEQARIVNVSSGMGSLTLNLNPEFPYRFGFDVVYGASKTALNAVTVAFAIELENDNITVNAVSPSYTATALNNFQGTDPVEEGSKEPIRVALDESGVTGQLTGPHQEVYPW